MTTSKAVADLVALAGGQVVGRTKLQKSACLLELTGLGYGFQFKYKHFGPYSEELKIACDDADALGYIQEKIETAQWGGRYSIFESKRQAIQGPAQSKRAELLSIATKADPVDLELTVTAAFLAANGVKDAWREVEARKPTKAIPERIVAAKALYREIVGVVTPRALPAIV